MGQHGFERYSVSRRQLLLQNRFAPGKRTDRRGPRSLLRVGGVAQQRPPRHFAGEFGGGCANVVEVRAQVRPVGCEAQIQRPRRLVARALRLSRPEPGDREGKNEEREAGTDEPANASPDHDGCLGASSSLANPDSRSTVEALMDMPARSSARSRALYALKTSPGEILNPTETAA